jgi:hypothetical protein
MRKSEEASRLIVAQVSLKGSDLQAVQEWRYRHGLPALATAVRTLALSAISSEQRDRKTKEACHD